MRMEMGAKTCRSPKPTLCQAPMDAGTGSMVLERQKPEAPEFSRSWGP